MKNENKLLIMLSFLLVFQSIFINTDFSYASDGTISYLTSGYFEYWRDPTTKQWLYDDASGRHTFPGPENFIYNYQYNFNVPIGYRVKKVVVFKDKNSHSNLVKLISTDYGDLEDYKVTQMTIDNANELVGATNIVNSKVTFHVPNQSVSERSQKAGIDIYRHYMPVVMEVEPITNPDKVVVKYQDMTGNTLKPDDGATALSKQGYNEVYPNNTKHSALLTEGYKLQSPKAGYHLVYNSNLGNIHTVIFKYEPPLGAYIVVSGFATPNPVTLSNGKGDTRITVEGEVFNLPQNINVTSMTLSYKKDDWLQRQFTSNSKKQQHQFDTIEITKRTEFPIRAEATLSNGQTLVADGVVIVYVEEFIEPEEPGLVEARLDYYPVAGEGYKIEGSTAVIELSMKEFNDNKGTKVNIEMNGEFSNSEPYSIDSYEHRLRKKDKDWDSEHAYLGNWIKNSEQIVTLTFKPSDINLGDNLVELEGSLGVRDTKKNQDYDSRNRKMVEIRVIIKPPETKLYLPQYFYPKEVTDLGYKNLIAWDYYSEDNIPYQHSIVSLYKLINDEPTEVIFENRIMTERELRVEGRADEEFRIVVKVVDELGNVSAAATEDYIIMNARPVIKVILDTSKEEENLLGVNVENLTPQVIESIFPTQYSSWQIVDIDGNVLAEGMGKVPEWIDIDERYYGNIATVIQYAENILNNRGQDHASYINNSRLDFTVNPSRLFELEMAKVEDMTRAITNKEWKIQEINSSEAEELLLDEENEFTQDAGKYIVWLFGDGKYAYQRNLYQYTNNKADLRSILPNSPTDQRIKELYGDEHIYAYHSGKWNGQINTGSFMYQGQQYKYRRLFMFYTITGQQTYRTRDVEFLSAEPQADLQISGTLKMYKKITLDGSKSVEVTNQELQAKYPILFDHERTLFMIEPIADGEFDKDKNQYILGEGKEIIEDKVVFRGKDIQHVRFDQEGQYRINYKVYNGLKESKYAVQEISIAPEEYPMVDINVISPVVYRNPDNELISEMVVEVEYKLPTNEMPKDEIDFERSVLLIAYDANHDGDFTNDEENSNQWVMRDNDFLLEYIIIAGKTFEDEKATFVFHVDTETKNLLGHFKFDFIAYEKPTVPNYIELGAVPEVRVDTFNMEEEKKRILIDNQKPVIHLKTGKESEVEIFVIDTTGNVTDIENQITAILNQLKLHRLNTTVYLIKEDGTITHYNN